MKSFIAILLLCSSATAQTFSVVHRAEPVFQVTERTADTQATVEDASAQPIVAAVPAASPLVGCHVVVFSKANCQPCRRLDQTTIPELRAAGIVVTEVDIDRDYLDPSWGIKMAPTVWVVDTNTRRARAKFAPGYVSSYLVMKAADMANDAKPVANQVTKPAAEKPVATNKTVGSKPRYDIYNGGPNSSHADRKSLINHLLNEGIHAGRRSLVDLEAMSDQELDDLHTEDHRQNGQVRVVQKKRAQVFRGWFGFRR